MSKAVNVVGTRRLLPRRAGPAWAQVGGLALCGAAPVYRQGLMPLLECEPAPACDGPPDQVRTAGSLFPPSLRCLMPDGTSYEVVPGWVPLVLWPLVTAAVLALTVALVITLRTSRARPAAARG